MPSTAFKALQHRVARVTLLVSALAAALPAAAWAGPPEPLTSRFFDALKIAYSDPDTIEMARYFVYEPEHASAVYSRVAAEDYVYVALLITAKAARNQNLPGIGTFDYDKCLTPTNAFEAIFAKSSDFIQSHGQDSHVKAYLQAGNANAKQQAAQELGANVPYWGDIPHICNFAFKTNFSSETALREVITGPARSLKEAIEAFASGQIVDGVGKLISAGLDGDVACRLADELLAGGSIEKVPVLGHLAEEACASIAGKVIAGIESGLSDGANAIWTGLSDLGDDLSGQTKNMPSDVYYQMYWAPRLEEGVLHNRDGSWNAFLPALWDPCVDYFDSHTMSEDNAKDTCNGHRDRFTQAVVRRRTVEDNQAAIAQQLPAWGKAFAKKWSPQCKDSPCENAIWRLELQALADGRGLEQTQALAGWSHVADVLNGYDALAADQIEASQKRFASANKQITASASEGWAEIALAVWTPKCWDEACREEVTTLGKQMPIAARLNQIALPDESSLRIQGIVNKEYGAKFQKAVDASQRRRILADPKATAEDKLPLLGCKHFLGRAGEWLCEQAQGFSSCASYVRAAKATQCFDGRTKGRYATTEQLTRVLQEEDCRRLPGPHLALECPSRKSLSVCGQFHAGGMSLACVPGPALRASRTETRPRPVAGDARETSRERPPTRVPTAPTRTDEVAGELAKAGCKGLLGRTGEYLCSNRSAFEACEGYRRKGEAKECRLSRH